MRYAIPGFQTPDHPKHDTRVFAKADGTVHFMFMDDRPLDEKLPPFLIFISIEHGREIELQAFTQSTRFVYQRKHEDRASKSYWFKLRTDELIILPGTYQVRFVVKGDEWVKKSLTVRNHPALPRNPKPGVGVGHRMVLSFGDPKVVVVQGDMRHQADNLPKPNNFAYNMGTTYFGSPPPNDYQTGSVGDAYIQIIGNEFIAEWIKVSGYDTNTGWE
jgi:hypothetical protein